MTCMDVSDYEVDCTALVHVVIVDGVKELFDDQAMAFAALEQAVADAYRGLVEQLSWHTTVDTRTLLARLVGIYAEQSHPNDSDGWLVDETDRYLLVERNVVHGGTWLTTFSDPADASEYHERQEYTEEWDIIELVDLHTGETHSAETRVEWV